MHFWHTIGEDFTTAIKFFIFSTYMPIGSNSTTIILIPKVDNPSTMADFKPILCCNTVYKCIAKTLAQRFRITLGTLIDSYEALLFLAKALVITFYHRNIRLPRCILKIDFKKAIDYVIGISYFIKIWVSYFLYSLD